MHELVFRLLRSRRLYGYEFAQRVGISESRFRRLLKGRVRPRAGELERIAAQLGITVDELTARER